MTHDPDAWLNHLFALGTASVRCGEGQDVGGDHKPGWHWTLGFPSGLDWQEIDLMRLDVGYRATTREASASHFKPEVAVAAVLALGPFGRNDLTVKASQWLDVRGCLPTDLHWTPVCVPGAYMLKIIRGDVR